MDSHWTSYMFLCFPLNMSICLWFSIDFCVLNYLSHGNLVCFRICIENQIFLIVVHGELCFCYWFWDWKSNTFYCVSLKNWIFFLLFSIWCVFNDFPGENLTFYWFPFDNLIVSIVFHWRTWYFFDVLSIFWVVLKLVICKSERFFIDGCYLPRAHLPAHLNNITLAGGPNVIPEGSLDHQKALL